MYKQIKFLLPLFIIFGPIKAISLPFMVIYYIYDFSRIKFEKKSLLIVILIIILNLLTTVYLNGVTFIANSLLFWLFILPIVAFIIRKPTFYNSQKRTINMKKSLEIFLWIQIIFSFLSMIYRLSIGFTFDVNFGDIIAGTLRSPFAYSVDASNVIFTFAMILTIFMYISIYRKNVNRYIVILTLFSIFAASVNHLILAAVLAIGVSFLKNKPIKIILLSLFFVGLYSFLQQKNLELMIERISNLMEAVTDVNLLASLSTKGAYFVNMINDIKNNFFNFLFTGFGAGTYSSRASLFFTGEYVNSFPFVNMSEYFKNNTYPLWKQLLEAPNWLSGAFHYPYSGMGSVIMELGLLNSLLLGYLFFKKIKKFNIFNFSQRLFLIIFILVANLIDNYFEYYQAFFLLYYILFPLSSIKIKGVKT